MKTFVTLFTAFSLAYAPFTQAQPVQPVEQQQAADLNLASLAALSALINAKASIETVGETAMKELASPMTVERLANYSSIGLSGLTVLAASTFSFLALYSENGPYATGVMNRLGYFFLERFMGLEAPGPFSAYFIMGAAGSLGLVFSLNEKEKLDEVEAQKLAEAISNSAKLDQELTKVLSVPAALLGLNHSQVLILKDSVKNALVAQTKANKDVNLDVFEVAQNSGLADAKKVQVAREMTKLISAASEQNKSELSRASLEQSIQVAEKLVSDLEVLKKSSKEDFEGVLSNLYQQIAMSKAVLLLKE